MGSLGEDGIQTMVEASAMCDWVAYALECADAGELLSTVTVAPITTTISGLSTEVPLGAANGLAGPSVASCENVTTIPKGVLGEQIGSLLGSQEPVLGEAIRAAFDLD